MTETQQNPEWPREIWLAEREEHDQGCLSAYLSQIGGLADHRYIDADIYESADRYWRERAEKAEAERDVATALNARHLAEIERLREAGNGLIEIVEGVSVVIEHGTWVSTRHDMRLKDMPEWVRFYSATRAATPPRDLTIQEAARAMLSAYDLSISGQPIADEQRAAGRHIALAASFAADAYNKGYCGGQDVHALCKAFLTALADPLSPDLDYLRADPGAGQVARDARAQAQGGQDNG